MLRSKTLPHEQDSKRWTCRVPQVAFVDLDRKSPYKLPAWHELDQRVVACARDHPELLQQLGF